MSSATTALRRSPRLLHSTTPTPTTTIIKSSLATGKRVKTSVTTQKDGNVTTNKETTATIPIMLKTEHDLWTRKQIRYVVGVDEAGRGPLAGPVVIAACTIEPGIDLGDILVDDSKKMTEQERAQAFHVLTTTVGVTYAIAIIDEKKIDTINILQASLLGMDNCVTDMIAKGKCDWILVDGPYLPPKVKSAMSHQAEAIKGGDGKVRCIAAASIIAKHTRDQLMMTLHEQYPIYRFNEHKGYPVPLHRALLAQHGPCPAHRMSYRPVREAAEKLTGVVGTS